jgi:eukaryotic-like serine/threonine-protein kinase
MDTLWSRVKSLFENAKSRQTAERVRFLDERCGADKALRREVEELLEADRQAGGFLEGSAADDASRMEVEFETPERLGVWRILGKLGQGGMSTVHLVERNDGVFQQRAALKILKLGMFGADVRRRFAQERQILAHLNHRHIVRLLDGGVAPDGRPYLVMDYVEGESLTEYLRTRAFSEDEQLELFVNLCEAVQYAHERSIVHRDLKPSNVMVTADGTPRLLDFGICKIIEGHGSDSDATRTGARYLTLEYASPEQIRGEQIGPAADVYSLGLILADMLLRRHPYALRGLSPYETERLICEQKPDLEGLPDPLKVVLAKALDKQPSRRYPTVALFAADIQAHRRGEPIAEERRHAARSEPKLDNRRRRAAARWRLGFVTAALLGVAGAIGLPRLSFDQSAPSFHPKQITFGTGATDEVAVSRDGKWIAYSADSSSEPNRDIWMQTLDGMQQPIRLTNHGASDQFPDISPDGSTIVFRSFRDRGGLYLVRTDTRKEEALGWDGFFPRFAPDGKSLAYAVMQQSGDTAVETASLLDRRRQRVAEGIRNSGCPVWNSDGRRLMFVGAVANASGAADYDWWTAPIPNSGELPTRTGVAAELMRHGISRMGPHICPSEWDDRHVYFDFFSAIWRVPVDATGRLAGRAQRLLTGPNGLSHPRLAKHEDGSPSIIYHAYTGGANLWSLPLQDGGRSADEAIQVTNDRTVGFTSEARRASLSADGSKLAYLSKRTGAWNIWIRNLETGMEKIVTTTTDVKSRPILNPTGTEVAFSTTDTGRKAIWITNLETRESRKICADCGDLKDWSFDNRSLLVIVGRSLRLLDVGGGPARTILDSPKWEPLEAALSPDGRWVAVVTGVSGNSNLVGMIVPADGGSEREYISITEEPYSLSLHWSRTEDLVYFFQRREDYRCLWAQRVDLGARKAVGEPFAVKHFHRSQPYPSGHGWVAASRSRLLVNLQTDRSDIWIAEAK